VLIVEMGLRNGFKKGFAAGAGAATADLVYATLAALVGQALSSRLAPYANGLRLVSAVVLVGLGGFGLWQTYQAGRSESSGNAVEPPRMRAGMVYLRFVGLTLLNPLTIAYFAALILGGSAGLGSLQARLFFVLGAALASLSWQSLLAGLGALAHRHLSPRFQRVASLTGNLIVIGLGARLLF
jgi:threonine/homoserine/homoserine lactone efflux protein